MTTSIEARLREWGKTVDQHLANQRSEESMSHSYLKEPGVGASRRSALAFMSVLLAIVAGGLAVFIVGEQDNEPTAQTADQQVTEAEDLGEADGSLVAVPTVVEGFTHAAESAAGTSLEFRAEGREACVVATTTVHPGSGRVCRARTGNAPIIGSVTDREGDTTEIYGAVDGRVSAIAGITDTGSRYVGQAFQSPGQELSLFSLEVPIGSPLVEVQFLDTQGATIDTVSAIGLIPR